MVINNGFTYIAFLMFVAGALLALEKYTKWKIFNVVPPLVFYLRIKHDILHNGPIRIRRMFRYIFSPKK